MIQTESSILHYLLQNCSCQLTSTNRLSTKQLIWIFQMHILTIQNKCFFRLAHVLVSHFQLSPRLNVKNIDHGSCFFLTCDNCLCTTACQNDQLKLIDTICNSSTNVKQEVILSKVSSRQQNKPIFVVKILGKQLMFKILRRFACRHWSVTSVRGNNS